MARKANLGVPPSPSSGTAVGAVKKSCTEIGAPGLLPRRHSAKTRRGVVGQGVLASALFGDVEFPAILLVRVRCGIHIGRARVWPSKHASPRRHAFSHCAGLFDSAVAAQGGIGRPKPNHHHREGIPPGAWLSLAYHCPRNGAATRPDQRQGILWWTVR